MRSEFDHIADARVRVIEAALPHVVFDGWSRETLTRAIAESGVEPGLGALAFPRGGIDLALGFHRLMDERLKDDMAARPLGGMRVRDRIALGVRRRLELVQPHREAVRRGATLLALPIYAPEGARAIWATADVIWTAAGDTATDWNWYSKRAILASVYSATTLFWLGDDTPGASATWAFLDRRIENVMSFEKTKAELGRNPLVKAVLWGPAQLLSRVRAPVRPTEG